MIIKRKAVFFPALDPVFWVESKRVGPGSGLISILIRNPGFLPVIPPLPFPPCLPATLKPRGDLFFPNYSL